MTIGRVALVTIFVTKVINPGLISTFNLKCINESYGGYEVQLRFCLYKLHCLWARGLKRGEGQLSPFILALIIICKILRCHVMFYLLTYLLTYHRPVL